MNESAHAEPTGGERRDREREVVIRLPNLRSWLEEQLPSEFVGHMRAAQREQLLALRSLIDAAIERVDKAEQPKQRRVEISVE